MVLGRTFRLARRIGEGFAGWIRRHTMKARRIIIEHGGKLATAGGDREGAGRGWFDGSGESDPKPKGKVSALWQLAR